MTQPRRINVRGIIYQNGKIFAQRLKHQETGKVNKFWCTPGGGLDPGESLHAGLHREMIEETDIAPRIGRLLLVQQFNDGDQEQLELFFHIENADDYKTIDLSKTTHGQIEVDNYGFIDPAAEYVLPESMGTMDYDGLISGTQPVVIINELN